MNNSLFYLNFYILKSTNLNVYFLPPCQSLNTHTYKMVFVALWFGALWFPQLGEAHCVSQLSLCTLKGAEISAEREVSQPLPKAWYFTGKRRF